MDCGLLKRASNLAKARSLKTQRSLKQIEADAASEREWPVNANNYEIVKELGKGAHAAVYYAHCKPFDEPVAIKKIDLDSNSNWDLSALKRETGLMRKFNHPNVLPLYTSFVTGRELWMVMPVMGQGSVRSIMKRKYPEGLDEVVIATIMYQVLLGLEYVHRNRGIHRDIKADNILLSEAGDACLADFGVAATRTRVVSRVNMDMSVVMATTFVGTPCWMAPEVMQQEEGYNSSADIWSFGITLIELATGKPPLARMHPMRVLMDTIRNPPPSLDTAGAGRNFSQALRELVDLCLHKDPDARPSASALLKHRFFKIMARDPEFLVSHFLRNVRPITPDPEAAEAAPAAALATPTADTPAAAVGAGNKLPPAAGSMGSFMSAGGPNRLKSTWYFPAELPTYQEAEGDEEDQAIQAAVAAEHGQQAIVAAASRQGDDAPGASAGNTEPTSAVAVPEPAAASCGYEGSVGRSSNIAALESPSTAAAITARAVPAADDYAANEQQVDGAEHAAGPCMVEVQVLLRTSHGTSEKAVIPGPKSLAATAAVNSELSPAARGVKLLKELSSSMKALLVGASVGRLGSSDVDAEEVAAVAGDYSMFAVKPRLVRGRPDQ